MWENLNHGFLTMSYGKENRSGSNERMSNSKFSALTNLANRGLVFQENSGIGDCLVLNSNFNELNLIGMVISLQGIYNLLALFFKNISSAAP